MTTLEILKAARELISVPERWTKGTTARDRHGNSVATTSKDACAWCAVGSVFKVNDGVSCIQAFRALDAALAALGDELMMLGAFNDTSSHPDVLALFDRAIAKLEAEAH